YGEVTCPPFCNPPAACCCEAPAALDDDQVAACCSSGGACRLRGFGGRLGDGHSGGPNGQVPSRQGPDYVSPQPKFHPVPTRPVFEPAPAYPPTQLIEPGISNPLRSHTATIA